MKSQYGRCWVDMRREMRKGELEKRTIKVAVCDDNRELTEEIKRAIIDAFSSEEIKSDNYIIDIYHTGEDLLDSKTEYEIILQDLDLGLGRIHGYEVAKKINQKYDVLPKIIILTSLADEGERSYEEGVQAASFVVKRTDKSKLMAVLCKFIKKSIQESGVTVNVTHTGEKHFKLSEIAYISKFQNETIIHTMDGLDFSVRMTIKDWLIILPLGQFEKPNKSVLVNMEYTKKISERKQTILIKIGNELKEIKLSKSLCKEFNTKILIYQKEKAKGLI